MNRYRLNPSFMARACRKLAADLRAEHAAGGGAIQATGRSGPVANRISRLEAATNMDAQAQRWEHEAATGILNTLDRLRLGETTTRR